MEMEQATTVQRKNPRRRMEFLAAIRLVENHDSESLYTSSVILVVTVVNVGVVDQHGWHPERPAQRNAQTLLLQAQVQYCV